MPLPLPMPRRNWSAYALPDNAPESLEIKSTRQVSKAEPVEPAVAEKLIDEARAVKAADDAKAADAGKAVSAGNAVDTESEQRDDADATTDSLGAGLDSILARRGN